MRNLKYAFLVLLAGCGMKAKYTVDDKLLSYIPDAEVAPIEASRQEVQQAVAEQKRAEGEADRVKTEIKLAENEVDQAKLEIKRASLEDAAAAKVGDSGRRGAAHLQGQVAEASRKAAKAKVEMLEATRDQQRLLADAAELKARLLLAHIETEKAKLFFAHNLKPPKGFQLADYTNEEMKRSAAVEDARNKAEAKKSDIARLAQAHQDARTAVDEARKASASADVSGATAR